ncbi:MAG: hypothetical protein RIC93_12065 [Alphaproteobacteria bacterium]
MAGAEPGVTGDGQRVAAVSARRTVETSRPGGIALTPPSGKYAAGTTNTYVTASSYRNKAAEDLEYYGKRVGDHPSLKLTATQEAMCQGFRSEWVRNYIGRMYDNKFNDAPSGAVNRTAGSSNNIINRMDDAGLDRESCRIPECYSIPHSGWWEPHCGYRVPDSEGEDLYAWVEWRDGLEPPSLHALAERKQEELRANLRGCPTCTGRHLKVFGNESVD